MIKVIQEEKISFAIRLDQLMREKDVSNGTVANYIGTTKATISSWRNGHSVPTRFVDEVYSKLAQEFGVDIEYLKCTQIEKRRDPAPSAGRKRAAKARLKNRIKKISPEEKQKAEEQIRKHKQIQSAIQILKQMSIEVYPAPDPDPDHQHQYEYQILDDHSIFTILQTEEAASGPNEAIVILPDGSECRRSPEDLIRICESIQSFAIDQFR